MKNKRILLKLSGEILAGEDKFGHDIRVVDRIVSEIKDVKSIGYDICIVVGAGNICRGSALKTVAGIGKIAADQIGMMSTVINAMYLQAVIEKKGMMAAIQSAIEISGLCELFDHKKAESYVNKGNVIIFAAGTGNPLFTTDTAAVIRSVEMNCDYMLKGTMVDGVYSADPRKNIDAERYNLISYNQLIKENLKILDAAAAIIAKENNLPIKVFSIKNPNNLKNVILDKGEFTLIGDF